jgi:cyclopropane fatty-acyl-phospholipid synthase-like methyltransferase
MEVVMRSESGAALFFNEFAETFDTIYEKKRNYFMQMIDCYFRKDMFVRFTLSFESLGDLKGKTVLDIGCGSGPYVVEALKRGAEKVTAVDPAPNMLAMVRQRLQAIQASQRSSLVLGMFPEVKLQPHDHVIIMGVMDYVFDAQAFLSALYPLVKESAVISFPSKHWFRTPLRKIRYDLRKCPVYFYDEKMIKQLAVNAGFKHVEIKKIPGAGMDYHVCLKP